MCYTMNKDLPLLATGIIVKDYRPLYRYWDEVEKLGLRKPVIEREDVEFVENLIKKEGIVNLSIIYRKLVDRVENRIKMDIAVKVYRDLGLNIPPILAKRKIAEILAGWIIEACDIFNIIKIRRR